MMKPNPAQVAEQRAVALQRQAERDRVKLVRQRKRAREGARIASHVDDATLVALAMRARPEERDDVDRA